MPLFRSKAEDKVREAGFDPARLPPGQYFTEKWPVLHAGEVPTSTSPPGRSSHGRGRGADHAQLRRAARAAGDRGDDRHPLRHPLEPLRRAFKGVHWRELAKLCRPKPTANFVIAHAEAGFTANVPLAALEDEHALVVYEADGEPLTPEHGWPVRLFIPTKYFWKSAKWLRGIELSRARQAWLLGALRLPQRRRFLEGGALRLLGRF